MSPSARSSSFFALHSLHSFLFALCPLLFAIYNERGQGSVPDTTGSQLQIAAESNPISDNREPRSLVRDPIPTSFGSGSSSAGPNRITSLSIPAVLFVVLEVLLSRTRDPRGTRIDLSQLSLTIRSVVSRNGSSDR